MIVTPRRIPGVFELSADVHRDFRGFLVRTYEKEALALAKIGWGVVQESWSHTEKAGTLRGLHFQFPPHAEAKVITPVRGTMRWVVVDLRKGSPHFGQSDSVLLSAERHMSLAVESGFAHGCISESDDCDLIIKSDQQFGVAKGTGIRWDDPTLGIDWGLQGKSPKMSERDAAYENFEAFMRQYAAIG